MLGDEEFANWWVDSRSRSKPSGPIKLKAELKQKGIASEVIDQAIKLDYHQLVKKACRQRVASASWRREKNPQKRKAKLIAFLKRRGFSWSQIPVAIGKI